MTPIQPALPNPLGAGTPPAARGAAPADQGFKNLLLDGLQEINHLQSDADQAVQQLVTGEEISPAEVLTAVQKADMAFRLMMQVRNKLVAAYQEVKEIRI